MKNAMILVVLMLTVFLATAQEKYLDNESFDLKHSVWNVGFSTKFTQLNSQLAGYIGLTGTYSISENLELGLKGEVLCYDKELNTLDADRSYHLQAGHTGILIEWHPFGKGDVHFSIPIYFGAGEVSYLYDKEFRKDMKWYDRIIDKTNFGIFTLGVQLEARIFKNWSICGDFGIRNTSPIEMIGTDEDIFNNFDGGFSIKYNF